jgi:hypothetical protein
MGLPARSRYFQESLKEGRLSQVQVISLLGDPQIRARQYSLLPPLRLLKRGAAERIYPNPVLSRLLALLPKKISPHLLHTRKVERELLWRSLASPKASRNR